MNTAIQILQDTLNGLTEVNTSSAQIHAYITHSSDPSRILPFQRAIDSYKERRDLDFCGHLRQCLLYMQGDLEISDAVLRIIEPHRQRFQFLFHQVNGKNKVNIEKIAMKDYSDLSSCFVLKKPKERQISIGDGELLRNYGYHSFLSLKQKLLMYLIKNQEKNETILACLPTGGGKSLAWELPVLSGRMQGMAIVVVPTIALAKDQEARSQSSFKDSFHTGKAVAYYGKLDDVKKNSILDEISSGQISILYISPEALLQEKFKKTVLEAGRNGLIGLLVVDEAHLVVQWGRHFRPEFQLLSNLQKQLQTISPSGLRTLLLSATLTEEDSSVLKALFSSDFLTEFRGDELRAEPVFFTHECSSTAERLQLVERLVDVSPRPVIVYVATPGQAEQYYQMLKGSGYHNCRSFTGETHDAEKSKLVDLWRNNEIDIMIATSAFGMGVDKPDIRTIITAYIPESISRFYQEVGRAGRDGYASLNYWLPFYEEDKAIIHHLTKSAILTTEVLADRWISLLKAGAHDTPDEVWLDMYHAPDYLAHTITGEKNKNWNIDVVLFLFRCGLIHILDSVSKAKDDYRIKVRLLDIPVLENRDALISQIDSYRIKERQEIDGSMEHVREMICNHEQYCYSDYIIQDFPYSVPQCSGCPGCRAGLTEAYYQESVPEIISNKNTFYHKRLRISDDLFSSYLSLRKEIHLVNNKTMKPDDYITCIAKMVNYGINIIIYPPNLAPTAIIERLRGVKAYNYLLCSLDEAESLPQSLLDGSCVLFYTAEDSYNKRLYSFGEKYLRINTSRQVVHVAPGNQYIDVRKKALREIVDCSVMLSAIQ